MDAVRRKMKLAKKKADQEAKQARLIEAQMPAAPLKKKSSAPLRSTTKDKTDDLGGAPVLQKRTSARLMD